jgi:glycosyltransferase involved in cell wall biosynthesis
MKVLMIYDHNNAKDGPGTQMFRLRALLRERGHDVRLFASAAQHAPGSVEADYTAFGTNHPKLQVITQTVNPSAYWQLKRVLREFQPDVVHIRMFLWQLSPLIMPLLKDVPTIYHLCHYKAICPVATKMLPDGSTCHDPAGRACMDHGCVTRQTWAAMMLQLRLFRRWQHVIDRYIAISGAVKQRMDAEGVGPSTVVYNAIADRPARPHIAESPLIVYAGRLAKSKGVDVLLRAMAQLVRHRPDAQLLIAGRGPEQESLETLVQSLNLQAHVTFLGHLPRAEMEQRFEPAWVQVVPSIWEEPFGNVVTEAMMRGTVVIASRVGGIQEIVRDGIDGVLVPPNEVEALAQALCETVQDSQRLEQMSQDGRQRAITHFSETRLTNHIEQIYQEVLHGIPTQS